VIINIDARVSGCTTCSGGPTNADVSLGTVVTLISPVQITLGPGTYTITNAATVNGVLPGANSTFLAYNFQAGNPSGWAWSFLLATDNGNGTGTMLKADYVPGSFTTQGLAASATGIQTFSYSTLLPSPSTAGFIDSLTLSKTTTLDFFIDDSGLQDNSAGVALQIAPEPSTAGCSPWLWGASRRFDAGGCERVADTSFDTSRLRSGRSRLCHALRMVAFPRQREDCERVTPSGKAFPRGWNQFSIFRTGDGIGSSHSCAGPPGCVAHTNLSS